MSNVDYDIFLGWATDRFGADNIRLRKDEILTHSPFCEDFKFNLWMRPDGGKQKRPNGVFRCWKTDRHGSLVKLVSELDRISYDDAEEMLCGGSSLRALEAQIHEYFGVRNPWGDPVTAPEPPAIPMIDLPLHTYRINDLSSQHPHRIEALRILGERHLPSDGLYVCTQGKYRDRIIIPYLDEEGRIVYWNARTMLDRDDIPKYMKPEDDSVDNTQLLYWSRRPNRGETLYLTEGEFDAMSLTLCGLCGVAYGGGKTLSDTQVELLRPHHVVIATDNDEKKQDAGRIALLGIGENLLSKGINKVGYIRPPRGYKDWNKLMEKTNRDTVKQYILDHTKQFTPWTRNELDMCRL